MLNKVMLIGHLGADPEVRYSATGDAITTINLATSRRWKDKQTGENKEMTEWHRVVFFNIGNYKIAEIAGQYLKKGSQTYVEGRLQTRKWQDKTGQDRYTTEIVAEELKMLGSKTGGTSNFAENNPSSYTEPHYQQPPAQQYNQAPPPAQYPPAQPYNQAPQYAQQPPVQQYNQAPPPPRPAPQFSQPQNPVSAPAYDDFDDDVPF